MAPPKRVREDEYIELPPMWPYGQKFMVYNMEYNAWYLARVVSFKEEVVRIRYVGWSAENDERIPIRSDRFDFEVGGKKKWRAILGAAGAFKRMTGQSNPKGAMLDVLPPAQPTSIKEQPALHSGNKLQRVATASLPSGGMEVINNIRAFGGTRLSSPGQAIQSGAAAWMGVLHTDKGHDIAAQGGNVQQACGEEDGQRAWQTLLSAGKHVVAPYPLTTGQDTSSVVPAAPPAKVPAAVVAVPMYLPRMGQHDCGTSWLASQGCLLPGFTENGKSRHVSNGGSMGSSSRGESARGMHHRKAARPVQCLASYNSNSKPSSQKTHSNSTAVNCTADPAGADLASAVVANEAGSPAIDSAAAVIQSAALIGTIPEDLRLQEDAADLPQARRHSSTGAAEQHHGFQRPPLALGSQGCPGISSSEDKAAMAALAVAKRKPPRSSWGSGQLGGANGRPSGNNGQQSVALASQQAEVLQGVLDVARKQQQDLEWARMELEAILQELGPLPSSTTLPRPRTSKPPAAVPAQRLPTLQAVQEECRQLNSACSSAREAVEGYLVALRQAVQQGKLQCLVDQAEYCALVPRQRDGSDSSSRATLLRIACRSYVDLPAGTLLVLPSSYVETLKQPAELAPVLMPQGAQSVALSGMQYLCEMPNSNPAGQFLQVMEGAAAPFVVTGPDATGGLGILTDGLHTSSTAVATASGVHALSGLKQQPEASNSACLFNVPRTSEHAGLITYTDVDGMQYAPVMGAQDGAWGDAQQQLLQQQYYMMLRPQHTAEPEQQQQQQQPTPLPTTQAQQQLLKLTAPVCSSPPGTRPSLGASSAPGVIPAGQQVMMSLMTACPGHVNIGFSLQQPN